MIRSPHFLRPRLWTGFRVVLPVLLGWAVLLNTANLHAQPAITAGTDPADWVQQLLGPGADIDPASVVITCNRQAYGTYARASGPALGQMPRGVLLTTGHAALIQRANDQRRAGTEHCCRACGDADLDAAVGIGPSGDACVVEFEVRFAATPMFIRRYAFSSEEYPERVNAVENDRLAILVGQAGDRTPPFVYTNLATLPPDGRAPISPGTVNETRNAAWYTGIPYDSPLLQHDGVTRPLYIAHDVQPHTWYHVKLVIADGGDCLGDSGLWFEAGALGALSGSVTLPPLTCPGETVALPLKLNTDLPGGGGLSSAAEVTLELSDVDGNFADRTQPPTQSPSRNLGTFPVTGTEDTLEVTLPPDLQMGPNYRVRVRVFDPAPRVPLAGPFRSVGFASSPMRITARPLPPRVSPAYRCDVGSITLTVSSRDLPFGAEVLLFDEVDAAQPLAVSAAPPHQFTTPLLENDTFYVAARMGTCLSPRATLPAEQVTVPIPNAATARSCGPGRAVFTVTDLGPEVGEVRLYTQERGGTPEAVRVQAPWLLATPQLAGSRFFYLEAVDARGCTSARKRITAIVAPGHERPAAPPRQAFELCGNGPAVLTITTGTPAGDGLRLYGSASSGQPLNEHAESPRSIEVPRLSSPRTFYVAAYYRATGCESPRVALTVVPGQPALAQPEPVEAKACGDARAELTVRLAETGGTQLRLYAGAQGPQQLDSLNLNEAAGPEYTLRGRNQSADATYYLALYDGDRNCESPRIPVRTPFAQPPVAPQPGSSFRCGPGRLTFDAQAGDSLTGVLRLYASIRATETLQEDTLPPYEFTFAELTQTRLVYLQAIDPRTGCGSSFVPVRAEVRPVPDAPEVASSRLRRCGPGTVTITALAQTPLPEAFFLYTQPAGGFVVASSRDTLRTVESPRLERDTTFYLATALSRTAAGCISPERRPIQVAMDPLPAQPRSASVSRCGAGPVTFTATVDALDAEVDALLLYAVNNELRAGDFVSPATFTQEVTGTEVFYFMTRNRVTGCESDTTQVYAFVGPADPAPGAEDITRCGPGEVTFTLNEAPDPGRTVLLFDALTGGTAVDSVGQAPYTLTGSVLNTTTTFFLESRDRLTGCAGPRRPVVAELLFEDPTLEALAGRDRVIQCGEQTMLGTSNAAPGVSYQWMPAEGLSRADISNPTASPRQTTTYTLTATKSGCSVQDAVEVRVEVPGLILEATADTVCPGTGVTLVADGGESYLWSPTDEVQPFTGPLVTAFPEQTTTYSVNILRGGCIGQLRHTVVIDTPRLDIRAVPTRTDTGRIELTLTGGQPPYRYRLDGGPWQTQPGFENLSPGVYSVEVEDGRGCLGTALVEIERLPPVCPPPGNLRTSRVEVNEAEIRWSAPVYARSWLIERRLEGESVWETVTETPETTATLTDLRPGTAYEVRVRSVCVSGFLTSGPVRTRFSTRFCDAPEPLSLSGLGFESVELSWPASTEADSYLIEYRAEGRDQAWIRRRTSATTLQLSGLENGQRYEIRVQSRCGTGGSVFAETTFETRTCLPIALDNLIISRREVLAFWQEVPGAAGYQLGLRPLTGDTTWVNASTTATSFRWPDLEPGTRYEIRIRTVCDLAQAYSDYGYWQFGIARETPGCPAVMDPTAESLTTTSARIRWLGSGGADFYIVRYREAGTLTWTLTTTASAELDLPRLIADQDYELQVRAVCGSEVSIWSATLRFRTRPARLAMEATDLNPGFRFRVYPNPADRWITIQGAGFSGREIRLRLLTLQGLAVETRTLTGHDGVFRYDLAQLPAGLYLLELRGGEHVQRVRLRVR